MQNALLVTFIGTMNGDVIEGDPWISNLIAGLDGNDVITGGMATDFISGDRGADIIFSMGGDDIIDGGAGNDYISGGKYGSLRIAGGLGNDTVVLHNEFSPYYGYGQYNYVEMGLGNDTVRGAGASDTIVLGLGNDRASGGQGDDQIYGEDGDDKIVAGLGNDYVSGGNGRDAMFGGQGDDRLLAEGMGDSMTGGAGADVFDFENSSASYMNVNDFDAAEGDLVALGYGTKVTGHHAGDGGVYVNFMNGFTGASSSAHFDGVRFAGLTFVTSDVGGGTGAPLPVDEFLF